MSKDVPGIRHARILTIAAFASIAWSTGHADTLGYSIYSGTGDARSLIATGQRQYTVTDLDVRPIRGRPVTRWDSAIDLEAGFRVGVFASTEKDPIGFGLWIRNDANPHGFSWNWFHHEGGQIYSTRDATRLRVRFTEEAGVQQMSEIEFLDDIELTFQQDICVTRPGEYSHVVLVTKGSVLTVATRTTATANLDRAKRPPPPCPKH